MRFVKPAPPCQTVIVTRALLLSGSAMSQDGVSAEEIQAMEAIMDRLKKYGVRDFASETSEAEVPGTIADSSKRLLDIS